MANNKYTSELLLSGKFEFDNSSLSAAAQFTQELVKTIEAPLQEMTQRIVNNLFGRQGLGQGFQGELVNQYGQPISSQPTGGLPPIQGGATPPPPPMGGAQPVPTMPPVSATTKAFLDQFQQHGDIVQQLTSRLSGGQMGMTYGPYAEGNIAQMIQKAQRAGVQWDVSPEQRETMLGAAQTIRGDVGKLMELSISEQTKAIEESKKLQAKLEELTKAMAAATDTEKKKQLGADVLATQKTLESKQRTAQDAAERSGAEIERAKRHIEALEAPDRAERERAATTRARTLAGISGVVGAAAAVGGFMVERPYAQMEAEAARAQLQRGEAQALVTGDVNRYAAIRELGGERAMMERSISAERSTRLLQAAGGLAGAGVIGTLGAGLFGGAAAGAVGGPWGAALGALGGLGYAGYQAYKGIYEPETGARTYREREIEAQLGKSPELRAGVSTARAGAMGAFRTAQALGDVGLESLLYGGITTPAVMGVTETMTPREREAAYGRAGMTTDAAGKPLPLRQYAAGLGVDYERVAAPMAGAFGQGAGGIMRQAIDLQTRGISPEIIAGMAAGGGGQDPRQTFSLVKDMYVEAIATGMDKSQAIKAMQSASQQAAAIGLGGREVVEERFRRSTAMAGQLFGGGYDPSQLGFAQRLERFGFGGGPLGTGGLGTAMRQTAMSDIMGTTMVGGKSLSAMLGGEAGTAAMELALPGQTDESLKKLLMARGLSQEDAAAAVKQMGGAEGLTRSVEAGIVSQQRGIKGLGTIAAFATGAETGVQAAAAEGFPGAAAAITRPLTEEQRKKAEEARKSLEAPVTPVTPGGKMVADELAVKSAEMATALGKAVNSIAGFETATIKVTKAINEALENIEREQVKRAFGN